MPEADAPPQGLVAGKYRLVRLLGRGGMGAVWEGVHASLGTRVAVKFIEREHADSEEIRSRFVNEARAAARLRSKHVVQVHDQGVGEDGRPYIVMELLPGETLEQRLEREGRLSAAETAQIVLHVSRALTKAHEAGIVHRDLKPENVFLVHDDEDGTFVAKVVDFGIAKFTDPGGAASSTRTGAVLGTPQFMSPEQARGLRTVDHRTDLWSLGVIAYRALVGVLPFRGEAVGDLLVNVCTTDPPAPSTIVDGAPRGLDAWVRRALAREPSDRFQSAAELADALAEVLGAATRPGAATAAPPPVRAVSGPPPSPGSTPGDAGDRRARPPRLRSASVLVVLFAVVTAVSAVVARSAMRPARDAAPVVTATPTATPREPVAAAPAEPVVEPVLAAAPVATATRAAPADGGGSPDRGARGAVRDPRGHAGRPRGAAAPTAAGAGPSPAPASPPTPRRPSAADELGY